MACRFELKGVAKLKSQLRSLQMARCVYVGDMDKKGIEIQRLMKEEKQEKIKAARCEFRAYEYMLDEVNSYALDKDIAFDECFEDLLACYEHARKADEYHLRIVQLESGKSKKKKKGKV